MEDDDLVSIMFMVQAATQPARNSQLATQASCLHAWRHFAREQDKSSSDSDVEGSGRDNTADGHSKAIYVRRSNGSF